MIDLNAQDRAIRAIRAERERQERLAAEGEIPFTCAHSVRPEDGELIRSSDRLAVLVEEVGEVSTAIQGLWTGEPDAAKEMRKEIIQVAAVALAWLEGLEADS
jgi:hypothetical protein